jgi:hypothetical protein
VPPGDLAARVKGEAAGVLPIREVSGLAIRKVGTRRDVLAIGDHDFELAWGTIENSAVPTFHMVDLRAPIAAGGVTVNEFSQFEGVTTDAAGRLFVLEENPGHVYVFDPDGTRLLTRIALRVRPGLAGFDVLASAWAAHPNSRGEGIVLLGRGHLLILKEKEPRRLIEFGPEGDQPLGLRPLSDGEPFELRNDETIHVVPLREWKLSDESQQDFPDVSDLHADEHGSLWILSDSGRAIGRVGAANADGRLTVEAITRLDADGGLEKPEGLAFVKPALALVACDKPERATPLFRVTLSTT